MKTRQNPIGTAVAMSLAIVSCGLRAEAQVAPLPSHEVQVRVVSGLVSRPDDGTRIKGRDGAAVIFATVVRVADAPWMQLHFREVKLSGSLRDGTASFLRITSLEDNAVQILDAASLAQSRYSSACFNGEAVRVELLAHPGPGANLMTIFQVTAGIRGQSAAATQCGPTDDRIPSTDPRQGRLAPSGCTGFLIDDMAHCLLTAGHCTDVVPIQQIHFNVPASDPDGTPNFPGPQDQYAIDPASMQSSNTGFGDDWAYFGAFPNSTTGFTPFQTQGAYYPLAAVVPAADNSVIRMNGFGLDFDDPQRSSTLQTDTGLYDNVTATQIRYDDIDTAGGCSGAPVIKENTGEVVGIHSGGDCELPQLPFNIAMRIDNAGLQAALANPQGICAQPGPVCSADAGDCFTTHDSGGCNIVECCLAVCALDPFCCETLWDTLCITEAQDLCLGCGGAGTGSCFEANGTPWCDDPTCCDAVCAVDPFCCDNAWDTLCKDEANELCGNCGDPSAGSCFIASFTPGCNDVACCRIVCDIDPLCCEVEWDSACGALAVENCCKIHCFGDETLENEPNCGLDAAGMPDDFTNGGCNASPPVFMPVECGELICGTAAYRADTGFRDTDWYELVLPAATDVTWSVNAQFPVTLQVLDAGGGCPGALLGTDNADGCEEASVTLSLAAGTYYLFAAPQLTGVTVTCGATYTAAVIGAPCPLPCGAICGPGKTPENEPDCGLDGNGDPDDSTNGGCAFDPPLFSPIACGESVCGTAGTNDLGSSRDTDWYELVLADSTEITWAVTAEFPSTIQIYDGNGGCPAPLIGQTNGDACEQATVTLPLAAGTYYLLCRPQTGVIVSCGAFYNATVTCAGPPTGACCVGAGICNELTEAACAAAAGVYEGDGTVCLPNPCPQFVSFFTDPAQFDAAVSAAGKMLKGVEDFEEAVLPAGECVAMDDPLDTNTDNGIFFPGDILFNLRFQSNLDGPGDNGPNPRGVEGLAACPMDVLGAVDTGIAPNQFADSLDIISLNPQHTALSMRTAPLFFPGPIEVRVFDENDQLLGLTVVNTGVEGAFVGFIGQDRQTFGRVNLWGSALSAEFLYEVAAYLNPTACPWDCADGDGTVGIADFLALLAQWGQAGAACDLDGGGVGIADFLDLLAHWGACP